MSIIRMSGRSEPENPPPGKAYIYIDSADMHLKQKNPDGTVIDLTQGSGGGGGGSVTPGGSDGAVQYNDNGTLGGDADNFYWDKVGKRLGIRTNNPINELTVDGNVQVNKNLIIGTSEPLGDDGFARDSVFTIVAPAINNGRERVLFAKVADSNNYFSVINTTMFNNRFVPTFVGYAPDSPEGVQAVSFDGRIDGSADSGTYPIITFRVQQLDGRTAIQNRPIAGFGAGEYGNDMKMVIFPNGNVGIQNTSPDHALNVGQSGDGTSAIANAWELYSDKRFKKILGEFTKGLNIVEKLKVYEYVNKRGRVKDKRVGIMAQDLARIGAKEVVKQSNGLLTVDLYALIGILINAIKELSDRVKQLEAGKNGS